MARRDIVCAVLVMFTGFPVAAAPAERPLTVRAAVGQAVEVVVEEGVGDLVRSGDPLTLKVEHTSGHLFITPMTMAPAELTIIDQRGRSHRLNFVFEEPLDRKIMIKDEAGADEQGAGRDAVMGLMRQMIRQEIPSGSTTQKNATIMYDDGQIRVRALRVHEMLHVWGYDLAVENMTAGSVAVPLQRIMIPGLLAVWSEKEVLAMGEKGRMHMVVRR